MSYANKSRDELIAELQELQGKYNYLKGSFDAYKAHCEVDDAGGIINPEQRQKRFESSLRKTEALFDKVFHCSPAPMAITQKPGGEYFAVNDSFLQLFELSREEVIGSRSYELGLIDATAREKVLQALEEKKGILNVEIMAKTKSGRALWLLTSLENAEIMDQEFTLATMLDISERRHAELLLKEKAQEMEVQNEEYLQLNEELNQINQELLLAKDKIEESLQTYSMLFESIPDAVLISEVSGEKSSRFIMVNDIACKRLGYTREELLTMTPFDINSDKSKPVIFRVIDEMKSKSNVITEVEHVTKNGEIIPVEVSISISRFKNRTVLHAIARDITERKQAEKLLLESENKFRKIYEEGPYGMVLVNKEFRFMMANNMFCQILGYSEDELKSLTFKQITYKEDAETDISNVQKLISGELKVYRTEKRYVTKDGRIIWGLLTATAQFSDDGQFLYNLGIINDISERKQTELLLQEKANEIEAQNEEYLQINEELNQINEELVLAKERIEESEETYRVLFESINDAVFVSEIRNDGKIGHILKVNDIACKRLEYTQDELLSKTPMEVSSEKMKQNLPPIIQGLMETHHAIFESEHVTKSGKIIPVEISTRIAKLKNKRVLQSIVRDITERIRNMEAIKQSEDKFRKAFFTNPDAITINRLRDGMYVSVNQGFTKIFGYAEEEVIGRTSREINIWHNYEDRTAFAQELRTNGMIENFETRFNDKEGRVIDGLVFTSVIELEGEPHILTVTRDVTERKRSELLIAEKTEMIETQNKEYLQLNEELIQANKDLLEAKERAEQSDRLKTAFLQNMSHEIRTPMNAIMGFSELLVDQYNNKAKLEQYSRIINQRSADLLNIINEILDVAKIESGQLPVNVEECNLSSLFSDLKLFFEEYKKRQNKQHLSFIIDVNREIADTSVRLDKVKLKQILINLIGNAFKFTDEGEIKVGCRFHEDLQFLFYVSDTGIGIPADKQEFIFERFAQLEAVPGRLYGGTGLGLSIVKGLIDLLGGKIWIDSVPGQGATFYFTFPYQIDRFQMPQSFEDKKNGNFNFSGRTILIVEDDKFNADYLIEVLKETGINIIHSVFGDEAVQLAKTEHPDMVLMDIRLPDIDGYTASRMMQRSRPDIKIIAQTAHAAGEDRDRAISAGCIDYISKPIKREALLAMIDKYL